MLFTETCMHRGPRDCGACPLDDAAICRNRAGIKTALTLTDNIDLVRGHYEDWKPLGEKMIDFYAKWNITQPQLREGRKATLDHSWDHW